MYTTTVLHGGMRLVDFAAFVLSIATSAALHYQLPNTELIQHPNAKTVNTLSSQHGGLLKGSGVVKGEERSSARKSEEAGTLQDPVGLHDKVNYSNHLNQQRKSENFREGKRQGKFSKDKPESIGTIKDGVDNVNSRNNPNQLRETESPSFLASTGKLSKSEEKVIGHIEHDVELTSPPNNEGDFPHSQEVGRPEKKCKCKDKEKKKNKKNNKNRMRMRMFKKKKKKKKKSRRGRSRRRRRRRRRRMRESRKRKTRGSNRKIVTPVSNSHHAVPTNLKSVYLHGVNDFPDVQMRHDASNHEKEFKSATRGFGDLRRVSGKHNETNPSSESSKNNDSDICVSNKQVDSDSRSEYIKQKGLNECAGLKRHPSDDPIAGGNLVTGKGTAKDTAELHNRSNNDSNPKQPIEASRRIYIIGRIHKCNRKCKQRRRRRHTRIKHRKNQPFSYRVTENPLDLDGSTEEEYENDKNMDEEYRAVTDHPTPKGREKQQYQNERGGLTERSNGDVARSSEIQKKFHEGTAKGIGGVAGDRDSSTSVSNPAHPLDTGRSNRNHYIKSKPHFRKANRMKKSKANIKKKSKSNGKKKIKTNGTKKGKANGKKKSKTNGMKKSKATGMAKKNFRILALTV